MHKKGVYIGKPSQNVFGPYLDNLRSHAALSKERKISNSSAFVWCVDRSYTLYTFWLCVTEKKKQKENKIEIFAFDFSTVRRNNGTVGLYFT